MSLFDDDLIVKTVSLSDLYKIVKYTIIDNQLFVRDPLIMNFDESSIRQHLINLWHDQGSEQQKRMQEDTDDLLSGSSYHLYVFFMMICMYSDPDELSDTLSHDLTQLRKREGAKVEVDVQYNCGGSVYAKLSVKIISVYPKTLEFVLIPRSDV